MKEIHNLVSRECFREVEQDSLMSGENKHALPILMYMLVKRDGRLKSRGRTDGRPQRLWTNKQDSPSPTSAIEALKYMLAISAMEGCGVTSFDLPSQFLETDMDALLHLKITGSLNLLLVKFDLVGQ